MAAVLDPHPSTDEAGELLAQAQANLVARRRADFEQLRIARDWALAHPPDPDRLARNPLCATTLGASCVLVQAHVEAELAAVLQIHPLAAQRLMGDAIDLHHRLPSTWVAAAEGRVEVWVSRKIARATCALDTEDAQWVDAQIADLLGTLSPGRLITVVEARVEEADQELADRLAASRAQARGVWVGRDVDHGSRHVFARGAAVDVKRLYGTLDHLAHLLRSHCPELIAETMDQLRARALGIVANPMAALKLLIGAGEHDLPGVVADAIRRTPAKKHRPRTICYVHLTPETLRGGGVVRAEDLGALTRQQLVDLLSHEHVTLKPVIDLNADIAADCYEVPALISEQLHLARPADCFPYAESVSRAQDQDHTIPYQWTGPPGQTRLSNLGRLTRRHHRIKTFGGWRTWQHEGRFTWISPHGLIFITDARGTHRVEIHTGPATFEEMLAG